jgi:proteasome lid subunit RPN8/RPN11
MLKIGTLEQPERGSLNVPNEISARSLQGFLFDGTVAIVPIVAEKIKERVNIWGGRSSTNQIEWAALLTGPRRIEGERDLDVITEFFELPTYNADKKHHLVINMDDVEKIDREYPVKAFFHSHPDGCVIPTLHDWMTFLYIDFRVLRRPILHIVMAPDGSRVIFSFKECHESKSCPLSLLKNINSTAMRR